MNRFRSAFVFFILLLPSKTFAQDVIQQLKEKIKLVKTMQGHLKIKNSFHDKSIEASGTLYSIPPDRFRMDLSTRLTSGAEPPVRLQTEVVLDGKRFWLDIHREESPPFVGGFDFNKLRKEFPQGYYNPADQLSELKEGQIKIIGRTLFEGKPVYMISGPPKRSIPPALLDLDVKTENAASDILLYIGEEDGITYYSMMKDSSGKTIGEVRLTSVKLNQPIPQEKFRFTPPAGASPVDLTPTIEEELEKHRREKNQ